MIDYIELKTSHLVDSMRFYSELLQPLGYTLKMDGQSKGWGDGKSLDMFVVEGEAASDVHFAFAVPSRATVDAIYAGYLRDPDRRLVEFVCQQAE